MDAIPEFLFKVTVACKEGQHYPHARFRLLAEEFFVWSTSSFAMGVTYYFLEESHAKEFSEVVLGMYDGKWINGSIK